MKQKTKIKIPKNCESFTLEFTFDEEIETVDDFKGVVEGKYYVVITEKQDYTFMFKSLMTTKLKDKDLNNSSYVRGLVWHNLVDTKFEISAIVYHSDTRTYCEATPEEIQEFKDKELESKFSKDVWYYYERGEYKWLFKLDKIKNDNFYTKDLIASNDMFKGELFSCTNKITKATQQQIDLFLKPKLEFKENEVWKAKF